MDRRQFLELLQPKTASRAVDAFGTNARVATESSRDRAAAAALDPFVPDASHPWDATRAGHLLRRTMMMPTWADLQALLKLSPSDAVDLLLDTSSTPTAPSVANDETESLDGLDVISRGMVMSQWSSDAASLRAWWAGVQRDTAHSIVEKMVLFWSGHFTTKFVEEQAYVVAPLLYRQNKLFRDNALGNFKDLALGVTLDGAMLVYLGGNTNTKGAPNENYARELMELFTTGLGWYTEADVQNAARILTGWRTAQYSDYPAPNGPFTTYFDPNAHDTGAKIYLNTSFPARDVSTNTEYLVRKEEIEKLIDTLFSARGQAIATFISRKLYRFFVYSDPNAVTTAPADAVVQAMADVMLQNNFAIKPVMSALLKSAHFFDNMNVGAQIKTPAEYVIGLARQLDAALPIDGNMTNMDQQFFEPPNVSGWSGYHDWVTTNTYPVRGSVAQAAITAMDDTAALAFINQFSAPSDANALARDIASLLLPRPLSTARQAAFVQKLTAGAPDYEWPSILNSSPATAARNLRDLLSLIVALPDFELC